MDQVTQQNALRVQSISGAAQQLTHQARALTNVIAAFRLEGAHEESVPAAQERLTGAPSSPDTPLAIAATPQRDDLPEHAAMAT